MKSKINYIIIDVCFNLGYSSTNEKEIEYRTSYPVLGITLGTPAGLNIVVGYYFNNLGTQVSGLYLPGLYTTLYGTQLNLLYKIGDYFNFLHNFAVLGGFSCVEEKFKGNVSIIQWNYGGIGYNLNWYGFYPSPQLGLQIGYIYRFNEE